MFLREMAGEALARAFLGPSAASQCHAAAKWGVVLQEDA